MSCRRSSMTLLHDDFSAGERRKENNSFEVGVVTEKTDWSVALFVLTLFTLLFTSRVHSSGILNDPLLRMEMGMHSVWITSIGIDVQNQFIVTGSQDKTVRVWELSTGKLIRVFRPPIGEGPNGMIFAVAVSPDGKTIACGGMTKSESATSFSFYLFDRESGKLVRGIGGHLYVIGGLVYL